MKETIGERTFNLPEGSWSDDSSLTLATLESLIANSEVTCQDIMEFGINQALNFYRKDISNAVQLTYYTRIFNLDEFQTVPRDEIQSSGYVVDSLEAAVWSILVTNTFRDAALCAVNLGKDTDTVGAIACGLAGLYYGYQAIPDDWLDKIQRKGEIEKMCSNGSRL